MSILAVLFIVPVLLYSILLIPAVQTSVVRYVTGELSEKLETTISIKRVRFRPFKKLVLDDVVVFDQDRDTLVFMKELSAKLDSFSYKEKEVYFNTLTINTPQININKADSVVNYDFLLNAINTNQTDTVKWKIGFNNVGIQSGRMSYKERGKADINIDNLKLMLHKIYQDSLWHLQFMDLAFDSKKLKVSSVSGYAAFNNSHVHLNNFNLKTTLSSVNIDSLSVRLDNNRDGIDKIKDFYLQLQPSHLSSVEIMRLSSAKRLVSVPVDISGRIFGTVDNVKGKNVRLNFGPHSQLRTDFNINGLPNIDETFLYVNVKQLKTTSADFEDLLSHVKGEALTLPNALSNLEEIRYSGNFTGFLSDLVAYGEFTSSLGNISTDIGLKIDDNNHLLFSGNLSTVNFNIGRLANAEKYLQNVSMSVSLKGKRKSANNYSAFLNGVVDTLTVNDYDYTNIMLNGLFTNSIFDGDFLIDDPNGQVGFNGKIDLSGDVPNFNFKAHLTDVHLDSLNISDKHEGSSLTADVETDFSGREIDDIVGFINVKNVSYVSKDHNVVVDSLLLISVREGDSKRIVLQSDIAEGDLVGVYNFTHVGDVMKQSLINYLPSLKSYVKVKDKEVKNNDFTFSCTLKNVSDICKLINPELEISKGGLLLGSYDTFDGKLDIEAELEYLNYKGVKIEHPEVHLMANKEDKLSVVTRMHHLDVKNIGSFQNLSFHNIARKDTLQMNVFWNNWDEFTNSGSILTTTSLKGNDNGVYAKTELKPSYIMVRDSLWEFQSTTMHYHPDGFSLKNFRVHHGNQEIGINGFVHRNTEDGLKIHMQNISISDVVGYQDVKQVLVSGYLNGMLNIQNLYNSPAISGDLSIKDFNFNDDELGDLLMHANYEPKNHLIELTSSVVKDSVEALSGGGVIDLAKQDVNLDYDISSLEIGFLNLYLTRIMQNLSGTASGQISVVGPLSSPEILGGVKINKAFFDVGLLKTTYSMSDSVLFKPNLMEFKNLQLSDRNGNTGFFNGTIRHSAFRNMQYDLSLITNDMLVMDTKYSDNELYFGEVYADGNMAVTGTTSDIIIDIAGTTKEDTEFFIPLSDGESAEESNFIRFVNNSNSTIEVEGDEATLDEYEIDLSGMTVNMELDITPDARCQVIFDSKVGDILKGRGNGNLQIKMDKEGGINFYGDFNFEDGDYMFTLQNVLNKKFVINEGSLIRWDGNPYDADIDLNATYKLKTSLLDLVGNTSGEAAQEYSRRIPVNCNLLLSDRLTKPNVQFEIKTPSSQDNNQNIIDTYINSEEEMNRQVLSLLVLNRFYSQENNAGQNNTNNPNTGNNAALVTTTEMLSNQLSHWLSQISTDIDIGVSYRPASEMTDDEVEVALSTQMFNNRVLVNGNVGYGNDQARTSNLIGDFDVEVKLNNSGSLRAKAYTRTNNDLVYSTYDPSPTTQGVGVSFREEFDTLEELMTRYWNKISGNNSKKEQKDTEQENKE